MTKFASLVDALEAYLTEVDTKPKENRSGTLFIGRLSRCWCQ